MSHPHTPLTIRCVGALVHDRNARLLLIQRGREPGAGLWSVPGGKVEPGESDAAAIRREVEEETGLVVTVGDLAGSVTRPAPDGGTFEIHDYRATAVDGTLRAGDDAAAVRWCTAADLDRLPLVDGLVEALAGWDCLPGS